MHHLSGFVHQDDLFDGSLTVLEHLNFIVIYHKEHSINNVISCAIKNIRFSSIGKSKAG